jgi:hypothetical protein
LQPAEGGGKRRLGMAFLLPGKSAVA